MWWFGNKQMLKQNESCVVEWKLEWKKKHKKKVQNNWHHFVTEERILISPSGWWTHRIWKCA